MEFSLWADSDISFKNDFAITHKAPGRGGTRWNRYYCQYRCNSVRNYSYFQVLSPQCCCPWVQDICSVCVQIHQNPAVFQIYSNFSLSSLLYKATNNATYSAAAISSAEFIWNQLYNGSIILDAIYLHNCSIPTPVDLITYNSGKFLEARCDISQWTSTWLPRWGRDPLFSYSFLTLLLLGFNL